MKNLALFYDTETTGMPLFSEPSEDPRQPHLVQLAADLVDLDTRESVQSLDVIIKPRGWEIPAEVSAIHGITTEMANDLGVPEDLAVELFLSILGTPLRTRIAHNETFDARILRIALKRYYDDAVADTFKAGPTQCTARMSTSICALPPTDKMKAAGRHHFKTPNLGEAYRHFTGQELQGAHSAIVDVRACRTIYFAMLDAATQQAA